MRGNGIVSGGLVPAARRGVVEEAFVQIEDWCGAGPQSRVGGRSPSTPPSLAQVPHDLRARGCQRD